MNINQVIRKGLLALFLLTGIGLKAQMSYEEFHAKYVPHNEKIVPDLEVVKLINGFDPSTGGLALQLLQQQADEGDNDSKIKLIAALTSCKREVIANILAAMSTEIALNTIINVNADWQRELMWFVDKTTYHNMAPYMNSILLWPGPQGPFGPIVSSWSPVYAGAAFDKGFSGMKGINNIVESYGGDKIGSMTGFGAFVGIKTGGSTILEVMYQNRTAKTDFSSNVPASNDVKFGAHTIGFNILKTKNDQAKLFSFYHGLGFQANFAKWSVASSGGEFAKIDGGINGGLGYNAQLFINPVRSLPVMIGLRGYAQVNFPKFDFNGIHDNLYNNPIGTNTNEDNMSGIASMGFQFQVIYKFGKEDTRTFKDFEAEVAENQDPHVNTSYTEILPIVSPDGKTLYFIRADHPYNNYGSYRSQDVWVADISGGIENATASRFKGPVNLDKFNMIAGVSPDGNSMLIKGVYNADNELIEKGYSMIYRTKDGWSKPEKIKVTDYDKLAKGKYSGAYWTQDGKHLILSLSEKEGDDNQDLYSSHLQEDGTWSKPVPLGATLNTDGDEHSPFLASDGKTLYFSSDREGGLGSNDIWMSKRLDDTWTNWSEPVNLGEDINTEDWDAYYTIDAQGQYAYKASNKNSKGKEDIVRIKLKEEVQPDPVVLIKGKVLNKKTNEPLDASIDYNGILDGKNYGFTRTNPSTGEYTIVLPYGVNYDFSAGANGFIGISDNLDLTGVGEYKVIERDLYLVPIEVGATVRLNNIFFETGKSELKKESHTELNRVIKFLNDNPEVKIEISGHTDNVGSASSNQLLSQQRADAVKAYLVANGIDVSRLTAKGYGMEKPVADNATDEGKSLNRRVEFTILEN